MKDLVPQQQQEIYITSSVEVRLAVMENTLQNINETLKSINSRFDKVEDQIENLRLEIKSDMGELRSELKSEIKSLSNRLWYLYTAVGTSFFVLLGVIAKAVKWIGT